MHRIKQYFHTAFRLLILGLLSSWTVVQRLIKYILERIIKKEEVKEAKYVSIADNRSSPVLSPTVQPETKTIETQVQLEKIEPVPIADNRSSPVLSPTVQPETKTIETQVQLEKIEPVPIADNRGSPVLSPTVQPETKTIETQVQPEKIEPAPIADNRGSPVLSPIVQPETKTIETESDTLALDATEAYCVKCRQKRAIQGARKVTTPKGRRAIEGTCSVCGTKLFRFIARGKENLSEEG